MRSTLEPVEPTKVRINVVVEPDELRPAIDRTARRLSREVRVPGFRKGKVPRQVIEARIGRDTLLAEAIEQEAVPEFYAKAIAEHDVQPLSRAQVEPPDYHDGEPLEFSATFEVKPELDLPPYRGIQVERPALEVTDEHVDAQLERLRERVAQLEVIGRPLAKGDYAQIDLRATYHTDEIPELTRSDFLYEVGSGTVVPKLDEELEGKRKGDILRFNATLPEEAGEALAGREVTFQVLVKEAKAKVLPKLDDDFAQEASEFDTLDELRADLRERLEEAAAAQVANELETRVLQAYLDIVEVPLPESLVHDELHYRANRFAQQLSMMGTNLEQYLQALGQTSDDVEADLRSQSERAVKAQLVLEAVAAAEGMEASDEEVEAELRRQAQRVGRDPEEVRQALADGRAGVISGDILRSKALAFMVEHATQHDPVPDDESEPKE
ncbi:MAG TPA: trigger factor [Actinomycetes bacterium]|nr:trigger factor [Actinomycetes bacterium]